MGNRFAKIVLIIALNREMSEVSNRDDLLDAVAGPRPELGMAHELQQERPHKSIGNIPPAEFKQWIRKLPVNVTDLK